MGVGSHLLAVFERRLPAASIKRFAAFHDSTFEDTGHHSTPQAWHHQQHELTALFIDYEYVDPELTEAFNAEMKSIARKARATVTTLVDYDGEVFEALDFEALRDRYEDLFPDGLRPEGDEWAELSLSTGTPVEPEPEPAPRAARVPEPMRLDLPTDDRSAEETLAALRKAPLSEQQVHVDDLVFERQTPDGPLNRLLIRRSSSRRDLAPFLKVLRGFVKDVTVESTDDVAESRDLLDLSVRITGQRNPFLDAD